MLVYKVRVPVEQSPEEEATQVIQEVVEVVAHMRELVEEVQEVEYMAELVEKEDMVDKVGLYTEAEDKEDKVEVYMVVAVQVVVEQVSVGVLMLAVHMESVVYKVQPAVEEFLG